MAWKPPGANELRSRVKFQKRGDANNDGGVIKADWVDIPLASRACRLMPVRGGEETMADRQAGVTLFDLVVRFDPVTRAINTDHRVVVESMAGQASGRVFAIKWAEDLEAKSRWIVMLLEAGKGDGRQS